MSDKMRWRFGDSNQVMSPVREDTVIEIGDLVVQDPRNYTALPVACVGFDYGKEYLITKYFLGVAMQRSRGGDTDAISVATTGVFVFEFQFDEIRRRHLGSAVIPACIEDRLSNHIIVPLDIVPLGLDRETNRIPIGYIADQRVLDSSNAKAVLIDIRSKIMHR